MKTGSGNDCGSSINKICIAAQDSMLIIKSVLLDKSHRISIFMAVLKAINRNFPITISADLSYFVFLDQSVKSWAGQA
jgi:hypothetical protein